jgi:hypothetical protein
MAPDATLLAVRRGASRRVTLALLLAGPLGIGSCVPRTLRTDQLEQRLTREIVATIGVDPIRVACPAGIEVRRGDVFDCVATAPNGDRLRIEVTQVDDEGGVTWEIAGSAE